MGLVTYLFENGECEIVSLDSLESGKGIGSALVKKVLSIASTKPFKRVWLITTNDNTGALYFYQKIGFEFVTVYRDSIKESRKIKPEIPIIGNGGIPIRDEIELEKKIEMNVQRAISPER
jgi:RimJ/RimL family protein N-acetyltransferase